MTSETQHRTTPSLCDGGACGHVSIGHLLPRRTFDIDASPISVGFETLDREHFKPEKTYPHLALLGAKWARLSTGWNRCEQKRGVYDFEWLDKVVDNLLRIGVQPFFSLGFGNLLYTPDAPHNSARGYVAFYYGDDAAAAWRNYVAALAQHFAGRVSHWEVWNEPNATGFWRPHDPDPSAYVRLLRETVPVIRRHVQDATIIGGVFSTVNPAVTFPFVEACFYEGMGEWIDKLTWHPYRAIPEQTLDTEVGALRRLLTTHAPDVALWQGECGCQSRRGGLCEFMDMENLDELVQAKWILRRILTDLRLNLEFTQYFHTVDLFNYIKEDGPSGINQYMGLLRGEDYSPKPSFAALQTLCTLFDSTTQPWDAMMHFRRGQQDSQGQPINPALIQVAAFRRRDSVIYAYWMPSDFDHPFPGASVDVDIWHGMETPWQSPVMIDPVSQDVYALSADQASPEGGRFRLPLLDAPLLLTDGTMLSDEHLIPGDRTLIVGS